MRRVAFFKSLTHLTPDQIGPINGLLDQMAGHHGADLLVQEA